MTIGIIGAGITGLTAAYELTKKGHKVLVFEKEKEIGGLAQTFGKPGWDWPLEIFFHHYFTGDKDLFSLLSDLNLSDKLFFKPVKTSVLTRGRIFPYDNLSDFLRFPYLSFFQKLHLGAGIFWLKTLPFFSSWEKYTAANFGPKLMGKAGWETIWQPLMAGKFGPLWEKVAFFWLWSRIKVRSKNLAYLSGSSKTLIDALVKKISQKGKIFLETAVLSISQKENKWLIKTKKDEYLCDKVIVAASLPAALNLVSPFLSQDKLKVYQNLESISALNLVLRLKRKFLPDNTYWLNILEKDFPFIALVEQTNFIAEKYYHNEFIVYCGGYYPSDSEILTFNKQKVFNTFASSLRHISPSFDQFLIGFEVFSKPFAQPIIPPSYSNIKPNLEIVPGQLFWATANHIYPFDRGVNFSIKLGKEISLLI